MKFEDIWLELYLLNYIPITTIVYVLNYLSPPHAQFGGILLTIFSFALTALMMWCEWRLMKYLRGNK